MKMYQEKKLWKPFCLGVAVTLVSALSSVAWAQSTRLIQTGRYLTVDNQPQTAQIDLLSPIIQVHFLSEIKTVGDAIIDVLRFSGYALVETKQQSHDLQDTLKKSLPLVDRNLGPMPLRQALTI